MTPLLCAYLWGRSPAWPGGRPRASPSRHAKKKGAHGGNMVSPMLDVQDVYANFDIPERVLEAVAS